MSNIIVISPVLILSVTGILIVAANLIFKKMADLGIYFQFGLGLIAAWGSVFFLWNENSFAFGGLVVADNFALFMIIILLINLGLCWLMALNPHEKAYLAYPEFSALLIFATVGMVLMASSTNLLVIFLGFEILSICLYFLIGIKKNTATSLEAAVKYLLIGAFSSAFVLYGMAFLFGASGSLDLNEIFKNGFSFATDNGFFTIGLLLVIMGLGLRMGFVPFHMWASDVYQGAPTPVTAFMISGVTTAIFAVLIRISSSLPVEFSEQWVVTLSIIAILTILVGNLLAISQKNVKRMLTYSALAHVGYIFVGLISKNNIGANSVVFYLLIFTFMNTGVLGVITFFSNKDKEFVHLDDFQGLVYKHPLVAFLMAGFILSLAGLPPLAGFFGRVYLLASAVKSGYIFLVIFSILGSVIALYFYLQFIVVMFMQEPKEGIRISSKSQAIAVVLLVAAISTISLGFFSSYFFSTIELFATLP